MKTSRKDLGNLVFFDLETKRGSAQVGWSNIARMGLSLAVTYSEKDGYQTFLDSQIDGLIRCLKSADAVVGFNHVEFDYKVLSAYTKDDLKALKNIDMFQIIYQKTGLKISLDKLAQGSLGRNKSGDGLKALQWYKEGRIDLIENYCREDVAITRDLYYHGCEKGFVSYIQKGRPVDVQVNWAYSSGRMPSYRNSSFRMMAIYYKGIKMHVFLREIDTFTYHDSLSDKQQRKYDNWAMSPGNSVHKSMVDHVEFVKQQAGEAEEIKEIAPIINKPSIAMPEKSSDKGTYKKRNTSWRSPRSCISGSFLRTFNELHEIVRSSRAQGELDELVQIIMVHRMRSFYMLKSKPPNLNCIFLGNKGTGKAKVAGIYGRILRILGVLRHGQAVEMDLTDLTIGHSREVKIGNLRKMEGQIKKAVGNLLVIKSDSINKVGSSFKSNETISVLMKKIENITGQDTYPGYYKLVTILVGNKSSISKCSDTNPGVKSLFPTYIHFDDLSSLELLDIFKQYCEEEDYKIEGTALELIRRTIELEYSKRKDEAFEIREYVENLFENIKRKQSRRLGESGRKPTRTDLTTILPEDV